MENRKLVLAKLKLVFNLFSTGYLRDIRLLRGLVDTELKEFIPEKILEIWNKLMGRAELYDDRPVVFYFDIEHQQSSRTISAPHMISIMLQQLNLTENDDLLILGAKSGYIAVLAQDLAPKGKVLILEANTNIAEITKINVEKLNLGHKIQVKVQNPLKGYPQPKPWQKILVTGAIKQEKIYPLLKQLDPNEGVLFAPIGEGFEQTYTQIIRMGDKYFGKKHLQVRFTHLVTQIELEQLKLVTDFDEGSSEDSNLNTQNVESTSSNVSIKYISKIIEDVNLEPKRKEKSNKIVPENMFNIFLKYIEKSFNGETKKYRLNFMIEILSSFKERVSTEIEELYNYLEGIKENELLAKERDLIEARLELINSLLDEIINFEVQMNNEISHV